MKKRKTGVLEERKNYSSIFFSVGSFCFFSFIDFFWYLYHSRKHKVYFFHLDSSISVGPYNSGSNNIFFCKKDFATKCLTARTNDNFCFFQSTIFFLFLFFFRINVLTSSLTSVSKSFNISRMRSPSELEAVDKLLGDLLARIGDDKGVSKSSRDNGLVNGLAIFLLEVVRLLLSSDEATEGPLEVAVEDDTELSTEARELVSDLVGLPPTFGLCCGGLGGGALGLDGLVVAMEAGLFIEIFLEDDDDDDPNAVAAADNSGGLTEEEEEARPPALLEGL